MSIELTVPPEQESVEALRKAAQEAAGSGDPRKLAYALSERLVLDGLIRRLQAKWESIPPDDLDFIVAEAVDKLYVVVSRGEKIANFMGYLWKTSDHMADKYIRRHKHEIAVSPKDLELIPDHSTDPAVEVPTTEEEHEQRRRRAIAIARSLLPRLGQQNVQSVMTYVIDAVEVGCEDLPNSEISEALHLSLETVRTSLSRGFKRLSRIARDENLMDSDFDFTGLQSPEGEEGDTDD